jgi:hypothetical protein
VKASLRGLAVPLLLAFVSLALWNTVFVYPLRLLVVFLHEISHGLAAIATGGRVLRIELTAGEGGLCVTQGGWLLVVLNAGYLGSLVFGAVALVVVARTRWDRGLVTGLGLFLAAVTLLYVRTLFGFAYGLVAGAALVAVGSKLPSWSELVLKTIGVVSCLYGVWDIFSDVFFRSVRGSDANALGRATGIPAVVWGTLWVALDVVVVVWALQAAAREDARAQPADPQGSGR